MKTLIATVLLAFAAGASAAEPTCADKAAEKKLAGAAKTSFMTKCEKDAGAAGDACTKAADEKKLSGAARNSFVKKCTSDAAASAPKKS